MLSDQRVVLRGDTAADVIELSLADCIGRSSFIKMLYESSQDDGGATDETSSSPHALEISVSGEHIVADITLLRAIQTYLTHFGPSAQRSSSEPIVVPSAIPTPLPGELKNYISTWESSFIQDTLLEDSDPWQHAKLIHVLSVATRLGIEPLQKLLSAWCADRIVLLSKGKSSMDAAEAVRSFFGLPNAWTEEEKGHLEKEMEYFDSLNNRR